MSVFKSKSKMITLRLTPEEYESLKDICATRGERSVSDILRKAITYLLRSRPDSGRSSVDVNLQEVYERLARIEQSLLERKAPALLIELLRAGLTTRQQEILKLLADGISVKDMAKRLNVSHKTIELHMSNAKRKLKLRSTTQLVRYGLAVALCEERSSGEANFACDSIEPARHR